jgi:pimeloyl-ACP methyl ester carboxylesterase
MLIPKCRESVWHEPERRRRVASDWQEEFLTVAGVKTQVYHGGRGDPLLVLHGAGGNPGWLHFHDALAEHFHVYAPSHPGFGTSDRPDWMERLHDLAYFYRWFLDEYKLAPLPVLGFSMGGWLAAEMAAMYPAYLTRMILVGAAGMRPEHGEIADIFLITPEEVRDLQFYDASQVPEYEKLYGGEPTLEQQQQASWDREMAALLTWKPYMYNPKMPYLLAQVHIPTLVVWGKQDAIVPLHCGERYQAAIPGARLEVIDRCGHSPQIEKPQAFLDLVVPFLTAA